MTEEVAPIFATFSHKDPRFYITVRIGDEPILSLLDSGSTRTYVGPKAAKLLGKFDPSSATMIAANNNTVEVDGEKLVKYKLFDTSCNVQTRYIKTLRYDQILGLDFMEKFAFQVDFGKGICSLPGGRSWKVDFPDSSTLFSANIIDSIAATDFSGETRHYLKISIKGKTVKALVDSGSSRTYLGKVFEPLLKDALIPSSAKVQLADNSIEAVLGEVNTQLSLHGTRKALPVRLVKSLGYDCILGIDFLKTFGLIVDFGQKTWVIPGKEQTFPFDCPSEDLEEVEGACAGLCELDARQRVKVEATLRRWVRNPGKKLATTNLTKHKIELTDSTPIKDNPRRFSPAVLKEMQKLLDTWVEEGIVEPCKSPWCSQPVMAKKADGTWRLCVDYRKLNARTKKHAHPIPNIDSLLDRFGNARYITKLDMTWAFLQVEVEEDSRDYTAFAVPGRGQFRFKKMPFGMTNSPSTYQEMMDRLIHQLPPGADEHVFAYLDDLCIVSETFEEHLHWLEIVLKALYDAELQINPEKCELVCSQVKYLGYVIDSKGLRVDPEKTKAIDEYAAPKNLRQLRRFLGMVGWYSRFMPDFSIDKLPLCELLRKGVKWKWTDEHQAAFEKIKRDLISAPVLIRPDFSKPFQLHCDASDFAIGAVLTQEVDGLQHPITFVNRLLTASERKFTTTEKECKAVLWAVEKLRPYLEGFPFTVYTDHSSLVWLQNLKSPSGRLSRWAMSLLAHDIKIVHRPGAQNQVPDALSRVFDPLCSAKEVAPEDFWYLNQVDKVRKNPANFPDWKLENDRLFVHRPCEMIDVLLTDLDAWKLVVPAQNRSRILAESHCTTTAGHFGRQKTYDLLARHYYWPGMRVDAAKFVKSCLDCQKNKQSQTGPLGLMSQKSYSGPWKEISADIQGPFPATNNQFKYLFVAQDHFTKFVVVKPLRTANGKNIWQAIREKVLSTFGYPETIIIDNGTEMDNKLTRAKCQELGIKLKTVPAYHPQPNPTERSNKTLKTLIRTFLKQDHKKWDEHVDELAFAINNAVHESTKFSPFFLNFGRNPKAPNLEFHSTTSPKKLSRSDPEFWAERMRRIEAYHDLVLRYLSSASQIQANSYNKGRREISFKVGDLVLRREHPLSNAAKNYSAKLVPPYSGPYKIKARISRNVFDLELPNGKQVSKTHVRFLKPYESDIKASTN